MDDDALLLRRLADGDRSAYEAIVRRHVDFVYAAAQQRVGDAHVAEDVAQAVFIVLLQKASAIAGRVVLVGWLYRTVGHVASNATKLRRRREHYERRAAAERSEHTMADDAIDEETLRQLDAALGSLRVHSRDAILLRFFQRQTFAEVGRALGISDEAAKKRVTRALDELRGTLGGVASAAAVVALLDATPAQAAPAALTQTMLNSSTPSAAAAALAKGTFMAITTPQLAVTIAAAGVLAIGAAAVSLGGSRPGAAAALTSAPAPASPTSAAAANADGTLVAAIAEGTIELIAVGEPTGDVRFWLPSGRVPAPRPFASAPGSVSPEPGREPRAFLIGQHVARNGNGTATVDIEIDGSSGSAGGTVDGPDAANLYCTVANVPTDRPATLRVRLATGPWQTVATGEPGATSHETDAAGIVIEPLVADRRGGTEARFQMTIADDQRAVAIDRAGREHVMSARYSRSRIPGAIAANPDQSWDASFIAHDVAPAEVIRVRVERRPINHTIEFRDLAVSRDAPTSPRVVIDGR